MKLLITAVLLGTGRRGFDVYGNYALKNRRKLIFIAVAEPIKKRREKLQQMSLDYKIMLSIWKNSAEKQTISEKRNSGRKF